MLLKKRKYLFAGLVIFVIIFALELLFCKMLIGDDMTFSRALDEQSLKTFLDGRYKWWSSRVYIETVMMSIQVYVPWLWYILNALISMYVVIYSASIIEENDDKMICIFLLLSSYLFIIPINAYGGSGWITCTINYLWVWGAGLVALYPMIVKLKNENIKTPYYIISVALCFFAMNNEQFAALTMGILVFAFFYFAIYKKHFLFELVPHFLINIYSLWFIFNSEGNTWRMEYEMQNRMPEFLTFSFKDKICNGIVNTMFIYLQGFEKQYALIMLLIAIFIAFIFLVNKKILIILPLFTMSMVLAPKLFYMLWIKGKWNRFLRFFELVWFNRLYTDREGILSSLQVTYYIIVILAISICLIIIGKDCQEKIIFSILFVAALMDTFIMGFSPTIIASGERTFLFGSFIFVMISVKLISRIYVNCIRNRMQAPELTEQHEVKRQQYCENDNIK